MARFFAFLLALVFPFAVIAQGCGTTYTYTATFSSGVCTGTGSTAEAAYHSAMITGKCLAVRYEPSYPSYSATSVTCSGNSCNGLLTHVWGYTANVAHSMSQGVLTSAPTQCADPCQGLTGNPLDTTDMSVPVSGAHVTPLTICETVSATGGPNGGPLLCTMSYTTKPDGMWAQSPNGQWYFFVYSATQAAHYKHTGTSCTGSTTGGSGSGTAPAPTDSTCPTGKCPGTINGTNVCVPCSGVATNDSTTTTTEKDSTGATTGTETTDKSVTCDGNYCTIKTQTTNTGTGGGGGGGSSTTEEKVDKKTFCEDNPTHPACLSRWQEEGCDKDPVCEGDPIACAQAKLAKKTYCENFVKVSELTELGVSVANGEAVPDGHPRSQATTTAFNFAGAFGGASSGGGGCPADVSVMGVVVPLSRTCDGLNGLGIAALGIALIWAARVVFGD